MQAWPLGRSVDLGYRLSSTVQPELTVPAYTTDIGSKPMISRFRIIARQSISLLPFPLPHIKQPRAIERITLLRRPNSYCLLQKSDQSLSRCIRPRLRYGRVGAVLPVYDARQSGCAPDALQQGSGPDNLNARTASNVNFFPCFFPRGCKQMGCCTQSGSYHIRRPHMRQACAYCWNSERSPIQSALLHLCTLMLTTRR